MDKSPSHTPTMDSALVQSIARGVVAAEPPSRAPARDSAPANLNVFVRPGTYAPANANMHERLTISVPANLNVFVRPGAHAPANANMHE
jgi:hypothetical protein